MDEAFYEAEMKLVLKLANINFGPPVEYVYNPLIYAKCVHIDYLKKYLKGIKKVLFLGMNPGPWGMMQNGIPFGECNAVREFLNLIGSVEKPDREHPTKQITGLNCKRSEISGKRFWNLAYHLSNGSADNFFKHCFVHNYFPLALLSSTGKNITPPELKIEVQKIIETACDESLIEVVKLLQIETVVAIGRFAEKKAKQTFKKYKLQTKVVFISHPSPRNAKSNKDWLVNTKQLILDNGLDKYFSIF